MAIVDDGEYLGIINDSIARSNYVHPGWGTLCS